MWGSRARIGSEGEGIKELTAASAGKGVDGLAATDENEAGEPAAAGGKEFGGLAAEGELAWPTCSCGADTET